MNKSELAKQLAKKVGLSEAKASEIVDAIFTTDPGEGIIAAELDAGRKVTITGFGTFESRKRKARHGRNPATGGTVQIPAKNFAHFRAGAGLKAQLEGGAGRSLASRRLEVKRKTKESGRSPLQDQTPDQFKRPRFRATAGYAILVFPYSEDMQDLPLFESALIAAKVSARSARQRGLPRSRGRNYYWKLLFEGVTYESFVKLARAQTSQQASQESWIMKWIPKMHWPSSLAFENDTTEKEMKGLLSKACGRQRCKKSCVQRACVCKNGVCV